MLKSKAKWQMIAEQTDDQYNKKSVIERLLNQRGYVNKTDQQRFLSPKLEDIQKPEMIEQMNMAADRIHQAINHNEQIFVYGDYDADGITSTVLLMKTLYQLGANCHYYIPHRLNDGYGLNEKAIKQIYDEGTSLIITVDNGIASVSEADYIRQLGMDLIITDHHAIPNILPRAHAIIHPQYSPDDYFKQFAGVGVAFQLATKLLGKKPIELLDLVAIGTIADLVSLREDNRILVYYGLKQLNQTTHLGLQQLIESCQFEGEITEEHVGFMIAPRLNAVGRLTNASLAVELLLTENKNRALEIVEEISSLNSERQKIVREVVQETKQQLANKPIEGVIMLYSPNWHEGVLGIVASKIVQQYDRPVFIFNYNEQLNELKGSARSIPAFNLFEHCTSIKHLFKKFGGHAQAAGMTISMDNFTIIKEKLNNIVSKQLNEDDLRQEIIIHESLSINQMTESLIKDLNTFAPFGMDNEKPMFLLEEIPSQIRQIGQQKNHLKLFFQNGQHKVNGIGFQKGDLYHLFANNSTISIVGFLQMNEWNGTRTVQMMIEDIAVNERQIFDYRGKLHGIPFESYDQHYQHHTLVGDYPHGDINIRNVKTISYEDDVTELKKTDILYICSLPKKLDDLKEIITKTNPIAIYVGYRNHHQTYLTQFPKREDFKWLYRHLLSVENEEVKSVISHVINSVGWEKDNVIFMMGVFFDLNFFYLENRKLRINNNAEKKDLMMSSTYQERLQQIEVEKVLYYSTYEALCQWLTQWMDITQVKREVNYT